MTKFCLLFCLSFACAPVTAQLSDNFSDGNFTHNPQWFASPDDFTVNGSLQLQSMNSVANATFSIVTSNELALNAEWEFWVKLDFNTSSANYADVWLIASTQDLNSNANTGYFVRIGSADDDICLYKKAGPGSAIKIIDGINGLLNTSSSTLKIKVIRTPENKWILLRDMTAIGNAYRSEGEIIDIGINTAGYFGISIRQSTASFFQKHFFDDFVVRPFDEDNSPLKITSVKATSAYAARVTFDKPLHIPSAENLFAYHINGIGNPLSATVDPVNGSVVDLIFSEPLKANLKTTMIVDGVSDIFGSSIHEVMYDFYYYQAMRYDVVISEVFADPSPQVGLPSQKFIELKNTASFPVNLKNWQLRDGGNIAHLPNYELLPDSFLIITTSSGLDAYKVFGKTIAVSGFPSLNIGSGQIALYSDQEIATHAMSYDLTSYKNEVKKDGGFSLEMINTKYGCGGADNWVASIDPTGGTPGTKNSVDSEHLSPVSISLVKAYLTSPDTLMLELNKSVDSSTVARSENFAFTDGLIITKAEVIPPLFNTIKLSLTTSVAAGKVYSVTVRGMIDCAGNQQGLKNVAQFGLAVDPAKGDVVINEILFDPKPGSVDYLELYNNSSKTVDVSRLYVGNRNSAGDPSSITRLSNSPLLLLPATFLLLTTDPSITLRDFVNADASVFLKMNSLPSFPDDKGFVLVMDQQGNIIDELNYNSKWHFSLIKDKEGVSLERISYDGPSDKTNFHSAASDIGFGTPGIKNSQSKTDVQPDAGFRISPEVFSPDNDGTDDFLTIHYSFTSGRYVTNIKIFDAQGRLVRYLEKSSLSGSAGYYRWDGLDDKNQKLPQGIYVIYLESFNEDGGKKMFKKSVVLARRF